MSPSPAILFVLLQSSTSVAQPVTFSDVTFQAGIHFQHESGLSPDKLIVETVGSGVAWLDYDNDGWQDLYFVSGAVVAREQASPGNVLFRNSGQGTFENVTRQCGCRRPGRLRNGRGRWRLRR